MSGADHIPKEQCNWVEDSDGIWATACGNAFELDANAGPPSVQGLKFCCYCGKSLKEFVYHEDDVEECPRCEAIAGEPHSEDCPDAPERPQYP